MTKLVDQDSIIFMKVGRHAGETFEEIVERKRREYERAGRIFWGYGGGTMHPITRVQPFVRMQVREGKNVSIVMQEMDSKHPDTEVFAKEFSRDGVTWEKVPDGIKVRGSRYALVLDELREGELMDLNLDDYAVGAGPSEGKVAAQYIRGRVDKGLLVRSAHESVVVEPAIVKVRYAATLKEPFAVLLRS